VFGRSRNDEALDRLEVVATRLEDDLRKVVIELSIAATAQRIAAERLRDESRARIKENEKSTESRSRIKENRPFSKVDPLEGKEPLS
jgi:hypothetical protein